uniref:DUF295 domain-containing protein n=1 Tax=Aegilops tauschii subsp. strangulata TaxID=200361 RepID=A0A453N835_AEGTS|nr:uncharacterized protein LOC120967383 isoform X2 [Aegilops tauschii subsp. strangulata]
MLAPVGDEEDETAFRVICPAHYTGKLVAFVFSSVTSNWCIAASTSWSSLGLVQPNLTLSDHSCLQGCFYWSDLCSFWRDKWLVPWRDKWLVLDTRTIEFCTIDFLTGYHKQLVDQPGQRRRQSSIVVAREEEALKMVSLVGDRNTKGTFAVHHTIQKDNDDSSMDWQLKEIRPLSSQYYYYTVGAAEGFLFLGATTFAEEEWVADGAWLRQRSYFEVHYFSLDVRTSELTKVCSKLRALFDNESIFWYFGLPPSLSKPSI